MIVTLYTKPDCALCDAVKRDLVEFGAQMDFALRESNILEDEALFTQLRYLIPVVQIDPNGLDHAENAVGRVLLYPPHDWLTLQTALQNALSSAQRQHTANESKPRDNEVSAHGE